MVNYKPNSGSFKKGHISWNKGLKLELDLKSITEKYNEGHSCLDISKDFSVSEKTIYNRLKEIGIKIRKRNNQSELKKKQISQTLKRKGIKPKKRYSGKPWNKDKKGVQVPWNKGLKTGQKNWVKRKFTEDTIRKIKEARAKQIIPVRDTSIEVRIQKFLTKLHIEYFTHKYVSEISHSYQCDIMIPIQKGIPQKTIIECFGTYWHNYPLARGIDIKRCKELREKGWRVFVFWENEIKLMELNDFIKTLK